MERNEPFWKQVTGSQSVEIFGFKGHLEPEPVNVDLSGMIELFKTGFQQFEPLWKEVFSEDCFDEIQQASQLDSAEFHLSTDVWVRVLYELAATFHQWKVNRNKLLDLVTPLYYARVASFVAQSLEMSSEEAEELVEEQAIKFEQQKDYLTQVWNEESGTS
jgi:hypothetical protein